MGIGWTQTLKSPPFCKSSINPRFLFFVRRSCVIVLDSLGNYQLKLEYGVVLGNPYIGYHTDMIDTTQNILLRISYYKVFGHYTCTIPCSLHKFSQLNATYTKIFSYKYRVLRIFKYDNQIINNVNSHYLDSENINSYTFY